MKLQNKKWCVAVCAIAPVAAVAQTNDPVTETPVIVTATRFEESAANTPANVTVITAAQIAESTATTIPDLLSQQAGINVRDFYGNNAAAATVDLRGFGITAAQNTLVLVDGRRLNDIDLTDVQWSSIPLASIERIEIVRGSGAVQYGSGAVTGVINIITKSPVAMKQSATLGARGGDLGTQEVQASANLAGQNAGLFAGGSYYHSDGYRENNRNETANVYADLRWMDDRHTLSFKADGNRENLRLPGARKVQPSAGIDQVTTDPRGTSTPLDFATNNSYRTALEFDRRFDAFDVNVGLGYRDKDQTSYYDFSGFPDYRETNLGVWSFTPRVRVPIPGLGVSTSVVAGFDWYRWDYDRQSSNAVQNIGQPFDRFEATQDNRSLYVQLNTELTATTSLSAGWRVERQTVETTDTFDPTAPGGFGSQVPPGSQTATEEAWNVGLRQKFGEQFAGFARAGRSYRFATLDELDSWSGQFQFLEPQTAMTYELGLEQRQATTFARITVFQIDTNNEIHLDPFGTGVGNTNLPPTRRRGVELQGTWQALPTLTLGATYTYLHARFESGATSNVDITDKTVPLVPTHHVNLTGAWRFAPQFLLSGAVEWVSSQFMDSDESNSFYTKIPAYVTADLKLTFSPGRWRFTAAINNLFNEKYFTYAVRSTFTDAYNAYPLPERTFWIGAQYTFE